MDDALGWVGAGEGRSSSEVGGMTRGCGTGNTGRLGEMWMLGIARVEGA